MDKLELLVAEAKHRDAGRSIARIHNEDMQKLGLVSGDIVEVKGKKIACAITWPSYPDDAGGTIRIDGDIRSNASVGIDDKVEIRRIEASKASKVMLAPFQEIRLIKGEKYLARILEGRPVLKDQKIRVEMLGSPILFAVVKTEPEEIVIVGSDTHIILKEKPVEVGPEVT
ncbi:MAG: AAA family ATPase, partial [Candidatus Aenigmarchaeota archaeon]|nr:AAA family ATPase [Candidatus Aenigmarchaeota archaeon]